ncbi:MAG: DUF1109 family protein [Chitinophagaceae bacterium]|nr:DUF1109 family protein [Oligoflexus sp.]
MQDDLFIKSLSRDLKPRISIVPSQRPLFFWAVATFFILVFGVLWHSMRPDVSDRLSEGSYYFEIFSGLTVGIIAAGSALLTRIPGTRAPLKVIGSSILIWLGSMIWHSLSMKASGLRFDAHDAFACMTSILVFSLLPGLLLFGLVKRGATTQPQLSFALVAIAMTSAAAAFLPLACGNDGLFHLMFGHALPLFILGTVGWFSGRLALRW